MSDWGQGYHVGIAYTLGFYPELAPNHLEAALFFAGFKSNLACSGARYCELGCGYGLTTLVLAATNPHTSFVGVDFNPTHIIAARALAESAGLANIRFVEASFDELIGPRFGDLGEFDIIALHGIYSWVASAFADARLRTAVRSVTLPTTRRPAGCRAPVAAAKSKLSAPTPRPTGRPARRLRLRN